MMQTADTQYTGVHIPNPTPKGLKRPHRDWIGEAVSFFSRTGFRNREGVNSPPSKSETPLGLATAHQRRKRRYWGDPSPPVRPACVSCSSAAQVRPPSAPGGDSQPESGASGLDALRAIPIKRPDL